METNMMKIIIGLRLILLLTIAVLLFFRFKKEKDAAYLWFFAGFTICPIFSFVLNFAQKNFFDKLAQGEKVGLFPFSLVSEGRITVGELSFVLNSLENLLFLGVLLVGFAKLRRPK